MVRKGEDFDLEDITTSDFQPYDSLRKLYDLYFTLSGDKNLEEFGFILEWPKLSEKEKREKYSKYACHELNFFLYKKDPEFFKRVVKPYIENKFEKTFLDEFLIGAPLTKYLEPWRYGRLNIVERILLGRRIKAERPNAERHVKDLFDLVPKDIERLNHLFKTALKGRALEAGGGFGLEKARERALHELKRKRSQLQLGRNAAAEGAGAPMAPPAAVAGRRRSKGKAVFGRPEAAKKLMKEETEIEALGEADADSVLSDRFAADKKDLERRKLLRRLYVKLEKTKEWAENNYRHLPIERQNADLVTVNAFWNDFAAYDGDGPFLSPNAAEASRNFTEMMFALSVLDLPFEAPKHKSSIEKIRFTLTAGGPAIVYHKEIRPAALSAEKTPVLVSQNFYRRGERYKYVGNEKVDNYISDEFLVHVGYGCHVVVTNPTSARQKLDVLIQVPEGAIPIFKGKYTRSVHIDLDPYRTWTMDYFFYFPEPGRFGHYPVHVAKQGKLVAFAAPSTFKVVEKPSSVDKNSWQYISQNGTPEQVLAFLKEHNLSRVKLEKIAWRMKDRSFFRRVLALLARRHVYNQTLWSYGIYHNDVPAIREYLKHEERFVRECGSAIRSPLLTIDPVERRTYQHLEYKPLVNARVHRLGKRRTILNDRFYAQYMKLLTILRYRPSLDDDDLMSVTYYLLLQDRVEEALKFFGRVKPQNLATRLQYDYFDAYLCMYTENLRRARKLAEEYAEYPVERWRKLFAAVKAQIDEIEGRGHAVIDTEDRAQLQTKLAATEASFDFKVESRRITINYQNLKSCRVNYYLMDLELLFSRNPFVSASADRFSYIKPNMTAVVKLNPKRRRHTFALPERFHNANVLVEIQAAGQKKSTAYFANTLAVQVIENYAQIRVTDEKTGKPLSKVYVKVYARTHDGQVKFYKDGYTDLRGRFDYGSLSTNEIDNVSRFAILVMSEDHGAVVKEASPPKR